MKNISEVLSFDLGRPFSTDSQLSLIDDEASHFKPLSAAKSSVNPFAKTQLPLNVKPKARVYENPTNTPNKLFEDSQL